MASLALGGILSGLMQGYDYQNALNRQDEIYKQQKADAELQRQRQAKADARTDTTFADQQSDRSHMLERRPTLEARDDADYGLQSAIRQQQVQVGAHTLARQPITDQQQDADFALGQQAKRQQIAEGGMRMRTEGLQQQLAQMGLDEKQFAHSIQLTQRALGQGFSNYQMTGDPGAIADAWNQTAGADGHNRIQHLVKNPDGSFTIAMENGQVSKIADDQHLVGTLAAATDPNSYLDSYKNGLAAQRDAAEARAKNPKNFSELIRGDDDTLQSVDLSTGRTTPVRDQTGATVRGTVAGKEREGTPTQIAAKFYADQIKEGANNAKASVATAQFMQRSYPNASGWWSPPAPVQAQWADPGSGVTPPPRFAQSQAGGAPQQRRIVRTGTAPDGTRVAQYDDGTVAPIQQ